MKKDNKLTYRSSGVDINFNENVKDAIKKYVSSTNNNKVVTEPGLFCGGVSLKEFKKFNKPCLVSCIVKNKIQNSDIYISSKQIAEKCRNYFSKNTIKIAFLDYVAANSLSKKDFSFLIKGFSDIFSIDPKVPIIGGETAEMPTVFKKDKWEILGVIYGVCEKEDIKDQEYLDISFIKKYNDPIIALSMDGVGTKTKIGISTGNVKGLIDDIVNHSMNDIVCQGAKSIGMVFYIGCNKKNIKIINDLKKRIIDSCKENNIKCLYVLIEEDDQIYCENEYDICGSIAGIVEKNKIITGKNITKGNKLISISSNGLHTNGYSLARKALENSYNYNDKIEEFQKTLGEELLIPHKNYSKYILDIIEKFPDAIKGIAHITGGGIKDNLIRILADNVSVNIKKGSWDILKIFKFIQETGNIEEFDELNKGMYETFNMGIGLILIVDETYCEDILNNIEYSSYIGEIVEKTNKRVEFI